MKNFIVEYENEQGFKPQFWLYLQNIDYSVSSISGTATIVLTPEQAQDLEFKLSSARQDSEVKK